MGEEAIIPNLAELREQDRFLPIANIARIMKGNLPPNAKISKEAKEIVQECVSEFISFVTSEASDKIQEEKRKTINGDDLLAAMTSLGFDKYVEPLRIYLGKYRDKVRPADDKKALARSRAYQQAKIDKRPRGEDDDEAGAKRQRTSNADDSDGLGGQ